MTGHVIYSIVVPVYNSADSLPGLCERIVATMPTDGIEIIFADDGSSDASWPIIGQLRNKYGAIVRGVRLSRNYGQHAATLCGFGLCKGDFVVSIDDDLQYDPADILLLTRKLTESKADVVYGISSKRQQSVIRKLGSSYVELESQMFEGAEKRASSFRLLKAEVVKAIVQHSSNSFMNLDNVIKWYTGAVAFAEVSHSSRLKGRSGYSIFKLMRLYVDGLINYSMMPLKVMTYIGFISSLLFFVLGVLHVVKKLLYEVPMGYTSIIVTLLFCSSIIVFCLGVIGQYLFRMYVNQQNKPLFSIKQVLDDH